MGAYGALEPLGIELIEHELDPLRGATPERGQNGVDLLSLQRDEHQIVRDCLVQRACNLYGGTLSPSVHDSPIKQLLLQASGAGSLRL